MDGATWKFLLLRLMAQWLMEKLKFLSEALSCYFSVLFTELIFDYDRLIFSGGGCECGWNLFTEMKSSRSTIKHVNK